MTEILLMNLSYIDFLTILELITIRNSSSGKNIKSRAIKKLVTFKIGLIIFESRKFSSSFCLQPSSALKTILYGIWYQKVELILCMSQNFIYFCSCIAAKQKTGKINIEYDLLKKVC